jgi:hypothetical protein
MRKLLKPLLPPVAFMLVSFRAAPLPPKDTHGVAVVSHPADRRVDITIDGEPFTSYLYPESAEKPVLYPIRSASGTIVTRGYPLEPRPGEHTDHPHHVGHWFNYGDVNGYDFWGNSTETPAHLKPKTGVIVQKAITRASGGEKKGELAITADWIIPDGTVLIHEQTRFVFAGAPGVRTIDRSTTWTAASTAVTFNDTKEGAFGVRVARSLESPEGRYLGSDGKTGDHVWGTRGPWVGLVGDVDGKPVTIAILNHPSSHAYPTYWHARGYGLFAANPIGQHAYDPTQPTRTLTLQPGKSVTFKYRILIRDAHLGGDQLQQEQARYASER